MTASQALQFGSSLSIREVADYSQQVKTLLIDANLRQPTIDKLFTPSVPVV